MKLTERQEKLLQFVKECHGDQVRKYNNEPYWNHVYRVAETVSKLDCDKALYIEIALCHDLFEDTECTFTTLREFLFNIGHDMQDARHICFGVKDLTDVFTPEAYPKLNRMQRKHKECERMGDIVFFAQTVKYADLIDNSESIVKDDKGFARVYLKEKKDMLKVMKNGDFDLYIQCCAIIHNNPK